MAAGGAVCALLVGVLLLVALALAARAVFRMFQADPLARDKMLAGLGYEGTPGAWVRPVPGMPLSFNDTKGWRWNGRLPRYGTLHLEISERDGVGLGALSSDAFLTQDAELDERFVVKSDRPSQTLQVLSDQKVGDLLLAMPFVHLELRGDEIVFSDPDLRGLKKLCGDGVAVGKGSKALKAEAKLHEAIMRLALAIIAALPKG